MLWSCAVFAAALVAGVVVHELGHAAMARRAGMPVRMVRLGSGPALLRPRVGRTWLVVRTVPVSGAVLALVPHPLPGVAKEAGDLLGGIGANAVVGAGAALAWLLCPDARWWLLPVAAAQGVLALGAAVPFSWWHRRGHLSDGERFRRLRHDGHLWSATEAQLRLA